MVDITPLYVGDTVWAIGCALVDKLPEWRPVKCEILERYVIGKYIHPVGLPLKAYVLEQCCYLTEEEAQAECDKRFQEWKETVLPLLRD